MWGGSRRHAELAGELVEWWEDLWERDMSSRVVLVAVPPGWGRSAVLNHLAEAVDADDASVTLIVRVNGRELPEGTGLQAAALRQCLAGAARSHRAAELLGMDRAGGVVQMGSGWAAYSRPDRLRHWGSWSRGRRSRQWARRGMTDRPGRTAQWRASPGRSRRCRRRRQWW